MPRGDGEVEEQAKALAGHGRGNIIVQIKIKNIEPPPVFGVARTIGQFVVVSTVPVCVQSDGQAGRKGA